MRVLSAMIVAAGLGMMSAAAAIAEETVRNERANRINALPVVKVWKSPSCGCCTKWVEHMRAAGFRVEAENVNNIDMIKRLAGIPLRLESCHTAIVAGYRIEGHVPAADVKRLLKERPAVAGLAVPGMVTGSPGMESPTGEKEPFDVVTFGKNGVRIYARYR